MNKSTHQIEKFNADLSYFTLRKMIGWSGILLPWMAWLVAWSYEPSISDYYYTRSGTLFTSVISLVGVFLITYRGYQKKADERFSDNLITWIGGILILIVAAIPTPFTGVICGPTPVCHKSDLWGSVHFGCAAAFFVAMSYLSITHFTRGNKPFTEAKMKRNKLYRFCGWSMLIILGVAGLMIFVLDLQETWTHLVLWIEIILLMLFGTSWLVKGKGLVDLGIQDEDK